LDDRMFAKVPLPKGSYKLTLEMDDGVVNWISIINIHFEIDVD